MVVYHIKKILLDDAALKNLSKTIMQMQARSNENIPYLKHQIGEVGKSVHNIMKAIEQGIFTASTKSRLEELEDRKAELEVALLKEEMKNVPLTEDQILFWLRRYRAMNTTDKRQRQQLIDDFINAVYLYDDHLLLAFNSREGTVKVPFSVINGTVILRNGARTPDSNQPFPLGEAVGWVVPLYE